MLYTSEDVDERLRELVGEEALGQLAEVLLEQVGQVDAHHVDVDLGSSGNASSAAARQQITGTRGGSSSSSGGGAVCGCRVSGAEQIGLGGALGAEAAAAAVELGLGHVNERVELLLELVEVEGGGALDEIAHEVDAEARAALAEQAHRARRVLAQVLHEMDDGGRQRLAVPLVVHLERHAEHQLVLVKRRVVHGRSVLVTLDELRHRSIYQKQTTKQQKVK